ncbi:MAG: hypothetical protein U1C46_04605 [Bacteroidales bacterium]|nr:hypothetical protein [Bacteroidales bacterium]
MNKKKAINILNNQKAKLLDRNIYKDETWVFQTGSYIKDFFGDNSTEYSFISGFTFMVKVLNVTPPEETRRLLKEQEKKAIKFLDDCIETISNKGLCKTDKVNFLKSLDNSTIIALFIFFCTTLFGIGYYFGTEKINKENIELSREVNRLRDSFEQERTIKNNLTNDSILIKDKKE